MTYNPRGTVSFGFPIDDATFTYALSGTPVQADVGCALTFDITAANTMKKAGNGDRVYGRLALLEDRTSQVESANTTTGAISTTSTDPRTNIVVEMLTSTLCVVEAL